MCGLEKEGTDNRRDMGNGGRCCGDSKKMIDGDKFSGGDGRCGDSMI